MELDRLEIEPERGEGCQKVSEMQTERVGGNKMRKIEDSSDFPDFTIIASLSTIRATHIRLHLLEGTCSTAPLVNSQIELYDVLLNELSEIHRTLANYFEHARKTHPAALA